MSKRNFILLIIVLTVATVATVWFLYSKQTVTPGINNETEGTNFISEFNPFGDNKPTPPTTTPPTNVSPYTPITGEVKQAEKVTLVKVSSMPIAGFTVFSKERLKDVPVVIPPTPGTEISNKKTTSTKPTSPPTEFMPAIRYVARATGNIYQTFADKIEERKFSETTIPEVHEAYFGRKGESVIMRYLKQNGRTIETFVGTLPKEYLGGDTTGNNEIKGSFLPDNIKDLSVSPNTLKVFYLFNVKSSAGESQVGTILNLPDNKKIQVFDSPFSEWLTLWPNDKMITLSTKPSGGVSGYMYKIDGAGKNLTKVLGGINGLTTLGSPDGKLILYGDGTLSLSIYHLDTKNSDLLGIKTLPEKCVWGRAGDVIYCAVPKSIDFGLYPDAWYQGEVSFSDQLWKIDVKNQRATILLNPNTTTGETNIDAIKLALDESENYLFFVNKKDSFLWKLDLK